MLRKVSDEKDFVIQDLTFRLGEILMPAQNTSPKIQT